MLYLTPPEDYDAVADCRQHLLWIHELLETVETFRDLEDEPPGLLAGYFLHGVTLAKALGLALQQAAGQAVRQCEEAARERGEEQCRGGPESHRVHRRATDGLIRGGPRNRVISAPGSPRSHSAHSTISNTSAAPSRIPARSTGRSARSDGPGALDAGRMGAISDSAGAGFTAKRCV